jgi:hypothetical protein
MPDNYTIDLTNVPEVSDQLEKLTGPRVERAVLQAAAQEVIVGSREHFARRESEPRNNQGFPAFGKQFPKKYFWSGSHGDSVAEQIKKPVIDLAKHKASIEIDSPALAHKADTNPPLIVPKGGRKFLAIPASVRAAAYAGMPRDFDPGCGLTFTYSRTPEGRWVPALAGKQNNQRLKSRGRNAGQRVRATIDKATHGQGEPHYWLVRKVQTKHDPKAMPDRAALEKRANSRAVKTLQLLTKGAA